MKTIKGPGIFLAQFVQDTEPLNSLEGLARWAAKQGYTGVQVPSWDARLINLEQAAKSQAYCDDIRDTLSNNGLQLIELGSYLQGQCVAMHPAYADGFASFHPAGLSGEELTRWATDQLKMSIDASVRLGTPSITAFSGAFAWHLIYPWPPRPAGLIDEAFDELARRWRPILDYAGEHGVTINYELHPGSDLFDGATFELFVEKLDGHPVPGITYDPSHFVLQQLDYADFIVRYHDRIRTFHVKDAEFRPSGRVGVYGGYQDWVNRAGRFRSPGDGQVDFTRIFSLLTQYGYDGWAILEWECCIKSPEQGAREGAPFIRQHIIEATDTVFDDYAAGEADLDLNRRMLGLGTEE